MIQQMAKEIKVMKSYGETFSEVADRRSSAI
jgi:hypothetical protein